MDTHAEEYFVREDGDGYQLRQDTRSAPVIVYIKSWSEAVADAMARHPPNEVNVSEEFSDASSLAGLLPFAANITSLRVNPGPQIDLSFVSGLVALRTLAVLRESTTIDYSGLAALDECFLTHPASVSGVTSAPVLSKLRLRRVRVADLHWLAGWQPIRSLRLTELGRLTSLDGLQYVPLDDLDVSLNKKIRSVRALNGHQTLKRLVVDGSPQATDFSELTDLPALNVMALQSGPPLSSFEQLQEMRNLETLVLQATEVIADPCSVAPLTRLPLKALRLHPGPARGFQCLTDIERLGDIQALESLEIGRGPKIQSLRFLQGLHRLKVLKLIGTEVVDGELEWLEELPSLREFALEPDLKRYSPSSKVLAERIADR